MTDDSRAQQSATIKDTQKTGHDIKGGLKRNIPKDIVVLAVITIIISILEILYALTGANEFFLLFHTVSELFSIIILAGVFIIGWNTRNLASNSFFLVLGTSSLFVATIDLFHTLTYKGMNIFTGFIPETNLPTQLWIAARYFQAITILLAFLLVRVKINPVKLFLALTTCCTFLLALIFSGTFPMAHDGTALTPFKVTSEYVIICIFAGTLLAVARHKHAFNRTTYDLTMVLLVILCISETMFTLYTDVFGFYNALGHVFKIIASAVMYKAVIEVSLQRPLDSLFKVITEKERTLKAANATLEREVAERTRTQHMLSEFLSMVTHELRSPLTVLSQAIHNLFQYGEKMNQEQKKNLIDGVNRNVSAMGDLIEDLSTISRIDEKKFVLKLELFNFEDAISHVLKALDAVIKKQDGEIIVNVEKEVMATADKKRIEQVIRSCSTIP
nr:MASE3 domain-containing protein [Candidatus Sigynarchaeota archaeon]